MNRKAELNIINRAIAYLSTLQPGAELREVDLIDWLGVKVSYAKNYLQVSQLAPYRTTTGKVGRCFSYVFHNKKGK